MVTARRASGWILAALASAALCGCGGGARKQRAGVNTGLDTLLGSGAPPGARAAPAPPKKVEPPTVQNTQLADLLRQQAVDTERILASLEAKGPGEARSGASAGSPGPRAPVSSAGTGTRSATDPGAEAPGPPSPGTPVPDETAPIPVPLAAPAAKPLTERVDDAAGALIDLLRQQSAETAGSMRAAAGLAGLEALRSGTMPPAGDPPESGLTPGQEAAVEALRDAAGAVGAAADREWTGPEAGVLADRLDEIAGRVSATLPLRVREARLCTRVRGFGQYTPLGDGASNRIVAGRAQRAIVYVELDRFAHREIGDGAEGLSSAREQGDRWAVELTQEINLYSDAGNLLVLRHPPERVLETSRVKRRDFYLVREISLPPTLGAGRYNLKVTLRDRATGAVAESVIPIEAVADAALTRQR